MRTGLLDYQKRERERDVEEQNCMVIFGRNRLRLRQRAPFPWTRSRRLSVRSLPRFSRTLEGYGVNQEFHLACAPACHWNACEPNPALGSLSQAASSANLCRSAGKAYQPVGRGPVILLCSIALPASHRIRRSPLACAFTKLIRPDPRAHGQVRPIG